MKQIFFLTVCLLSAPLHADLLEMILHPFQAPTLSPTQKFQLSFLQTELSKYSVQTRKQWTANINVLVMIEETELAVQQSPLATQNEMKNQIIETFESFGIPILFTSDNMIIRVTPPTPRKEHGTSAHQPKPSSKSSTAHASHQPKRIKGAKRTFEKLKKARLERERKKQEAFTEFIKKQQELVEKRRLEIDTDSPKPKDSFTQGAYEKLHEPKPKIFERPAPYRVEPEPTEEPIDEPEHEDPFAEHRFVQENG